MVLFYVNQTPFDLIQTWVQVGNLSQGEARRCRSHSIFSRSSYLFSYYLFHFLFLRMFFVYDTSTIQSSHNIPLFFLFNHILSCFEHMNFLLFSASRMLYQITFELDPCHKYTISHFCSLSIAHPHEILLC